MMDYLVKHSQQFFSSEHVNITLVFMCGVHNLTKNLIVQNLEVFVMRGDTEMWYNVVIDMLNQETVKPQFDTQLNKPSCTSIQFFNVGSVTITTLTMMCPSISLEGGLLAIKNSHINGHSSTNEVLSSVYIIGKHSQVLLDNCKFKENCFVVSDKSAEIIVVNSTFLAYSHERQSMITAHSRSVIRLTGNVNFTDSVLGHSCYGVAISMWTITNLGLKALLHITADANVHFVNLTCNGPGGAVCVGDGEFTIGAKATVLFMNNNANFGGGALFLQNGMFNVKPNASINFVHNSSPSHHGGAVFLSNASVIIGTNTSINFIHNSSPSASGGAVFLRNASITIGANASLLFYNNVATYGGAMYFQFGALIVNDHGVVNFSENSAQSQGGAVYTEVGEHSITLKESAKLLFHKNSAFQGGAVYVIPSSYAIEVGIESIIEFVNNTAADVGGAVYAEMQSVTPCLFSILDYSAEISFVGNCANNSIGQHMYGTSVRDVRCTILSHRSLAEAMKYCATLDNIRHINISFRPDLSETLSPVSSAPMRVCLCDMNGRPQCADLLQIFNSTKVYRGEAFTLSAYVVGYDFGTTVGNVHARFLSESSHQHTLLEQSQYSQPVNDSEKCSTLTYTVYTKRRYELLQISTSPLPGNVYSKIYEDFISKLIWQYNRHQFKCLRYFLLKTPVFINISLLSGCPPGLTLGGDPPGCGCYSVLPKNDFQCCIQNKTGYLIWNTTMWVNATFNNSRSNGIIYGPFCPLNYCTLSRKKVNLQDNPNEQCASNRAGILCGACKTKFSLAIGSSRCIECSKDSNLALLLLFAAGGVFLVFFILALNLTVTQGLVNGLIFYANIVWAYKVMLFPSETQENDAFYFLQGFVAWLNLDYGIEACFFEGLDAYRKTWLQFLFPFYIWAIAGVIIVACHYSSRLTKLIGSRAVPLLATLFLLSFMKLLRTIIDATSVAVITRYPQNTSFAVWYLDGNLDYCHPHTYFSS